MKYLLEDNTIHILNQKACLPGFKWLNQSCVAGAVRSPALFTGAGDELFMLAPTFWLLNTVAVKNIVHISVGQFYLWSGATFVHA